MKNKLLDYILLEADIYKRPLRKRYILMLLCCGAGFVIMMNYAAKNGFGFLNNAYSIIMTIVLIFFSGIFSMVVFSWPATDLSASVGKASGKLGVTVKRMKIAKGFLFAVIYTGAISALLKLLFNYFAEFETAAAISQVITIVASLWAGAMLTRCITTVFEETMPRKIIVFLISSVWYYVIIAQIMGFIIKSAYSIIL